jgi:hypothetical protein
MMMADAFRLRLMRAGATVVAIVSVAACGPTNGPSAGPGGGPEVPAGNYQCYQYSYPSGYLFFGSVEFKSGTQYKPGNAAGGSYSMSSDGKITFNDGNYKDNGWDAEYHRADGQNYKSETVVLDPKNLKISCHT